MQTGKIERVDNTADKIKAARLSLLFNAASMLLKFAAAAVTGSLGLLSEAIHSATDIVSSAIALASIRAAAAPPDEDHPYGHGKIESLAGFGESILLFGIVIYVFFEAIHRLFTKTAVEAVPIGIWLMIFSTLGASAVGSYVHKIAKKTDSVALRGNAQHLFVDAVTSLGVLAALTLIYFLKAPWIDPAFALVLAVWMGYGAWKLSRDAFHDLIDVRLPEAEVQTVIKLVQSTDGVISFHKLRTRRVGEVRHIDLHLVLPSDWDLVNAHDCADALEKRIEHELHPAHVVIHVDPYDSKKAQKQT